MRTTLGAMVGAAALVTMAPMASGCMIQTSDAAKFREPIPQAGDATLSVHGSQVSGGGTTNAASGIRIQDYGGNDGGASGLATYYQFTRDVADGVDWGTAAILGTLVAITDLPPTTIDANHAVWGPGRGDALDPIVWKLEVKQVADREFDYEVDGRPHLSTSDADWKPILQGHGWGKTHPNYRSGSFQIDNDAFRSLDPQRGKSTGTVSVTFDARTYPVTISADVKTNDGSGTWFDVTVTHQSNGSGTVVIGALADISTPKDGVNENVALNSRWSATGAGRGDVKMSGGDLPSTVLASECWSDAYVRSYYTDNVNYQPTSGDPSTCAFSQAQFSQ